MRSSRSSSPVESVSVAAKDPFVDPPNSLCHRAFAIHCVISTCISISLMIDLITSSHQLNGGRTNCGIVPLNRLFCKFLRQSGKQVSSGIRQQRRRTMIRGTIAQWPTLSFPSIDCFASSCSQSSVKAMLGTATATTHKVPSWDNCPIVGVIIPVNRLSLKSLRGTDGEFETYAKRRTRPGVPPIVQSSTVALLSIDCRSRSCAGRRQPEVRA